MKAQGTHRRLLSVLFDLGLPPKTHLDGLTARRVDGGANSILYRVSGPDGVWAYKLCMRDKRQRARREYLALSALDESGLAIAPRPLLLDESTWAHDALVATWLDGVVCAKPPDGAGEWQQLVALYGRLHTLTRSGTSLPIPLGVQRASTAEDCVRLVYEQIARLPHEARLDPLPRLIERLAKTRFPRWPQPVESLCHIDGNTTNLIRRPEGWCAVDWENAGWSDSALDMAMLITHAAYVDVNMNRWQWLIEAYSAASSDPHVAIRIRSYWRILAVWWVVRMMRYLREVPLGKDERLVARPEGWIEDARHKLAHYVRLAEAMI